MVRSYLGRRALAAATGAAAVTLTLGACGSGSSSSSATTPAGRPTTTSAVDQSLAAKVPAEVKADGKITIGTDPTYAPSESLDTDGKTVVGFDVELFDAVAAKLGLKTAYVPSKFGDIIAGVQSGKYEVGVSSFTINDDRKKVVNMVSYFSAGTQWATKKGNPDGIDSANACGKKIAVQKDTVQVDDITGRSKKCTDAGKPAITIDQYQDQGQATAGVVSGKEQAMLADSPVCAYAVKQTNGQLQVFGDIYDSAPYGFVIKKEQADFAEALKSAVAEVISDGTYQKVLDKWGVTGGAVTTPAVNP